MKSYTVDDIIHAECELTPLRCILCGSYEVTCHQYIGDAYCANCGNWQKGEEYEKRKNH